MPEASNSNILPKRKYMVGKILYDRYDTFLCFVDFSGCLYFITRLVSSTSFHCLHLVFFLLYLSKMSYEKRIGNTCPFCLVWFDKQIAKHIRYYLFALHLVDFFFSFCMILIVFWGFFFILLYS